MRTKPIVLVLAVFAVLCAAPAATFAQEATEQAAQMAAKGEALLKAGNIDESSKAFLGAARAAPNNEAYVQRALVLRRVQGLRRYVAGNQPSPRWQSSAVSLHLFYLQNGLASLALPLDMMVQEKMPSLEAAARLAETHLELGQNIEAANVAGLHSGTSAQHAVYHAIALARLGTVEAAQRVAQGALTVNKEISPAEGFEYARMWTLLGKPDSAILLLKSSFERTPAAALPSFKERVKVAPDLKSLAALPAFAEVLKTESTVKQTCSGGSSCGNCPNRGGCGK